MTTLGVYIEDWGMVWRDLPETQQFLNQTHNWLWEEEIKPSKYSWPWRISLQLRTMLFLSTEWLQRQWIFIIVIVQHLCILELSISVKFYIPRAIQISLMMEATYPLEGNAFITKILMLVFCHFYSFGDYIAQSHRFKNILK